MVLIIILKNLNVNHIFLKRENIDDIGNEKESKFC